MFLSVFWYLSLVPWQFRCWYIWVIFEFLGTNAPTPLSTIKSFFAFLGGQLTPSLFNFWIISEAVFYCSAAVSINLRVKQLLAWLKCFSAVTSCRCSTGSHSGVDYGNMFPWKWYRYILLWAFTFLHILCYYFRYVMSWPWLDCTRSSLNFCSGLPGPLWCPAPGGGGRGGGPAQLGAGGGVLDSLLLGTLSTGALLLGAEGVVGGEEGCSTLSAASTGCPRLGGAGGLFVLPLSKFCILSLSYFLSFYF